MVTSIDITEYCENFNVKLQKSTYFNPKLRTAFTMPSENRCWVIKGYYLKDWQYPICKLNSILVIMEVL